LLVLASIACAGPTSEREITSTARTRASHRRAEPADQPGTSEPRARGAAAAKAQEPLRDPLQLVSDGGSADAPKASQAVADAPDRGTRQEKHVAVQGIEGTLSNFDVRVAMEKQSKAFAKCHEPRVRKVPALAGSIEFKIHVLTSGEVSDVFVRVSDLGDRVLERCLSEVIHATRFPAPHGGEADVSWNMLLEPARKGRAPEQWETAHVERVLRKLGSEVLATCDAKRGGPITVTAYVSRSGRVLAAGLSAARQPPPEQFDCIAEELRSWPMPKPRKGIAKVTFPLRSGA
jgi:hypothetical protein